MPRPPSRSARATKLVKLYLFHHKLRKQRICRRLALVKQLGLKSHGKRSANVTKFKPLPVMPRVYHSGSDNSSSDYSTWSSSTGWLNDMSSENSEGGNDSNDHGDLDHPTHEEMDLDLDSEDDADDEWSSQSDGDDEDGTIQMGASLGRWVREEIETMYAHRYECPRDQLPCGPSYLQHVLTFQKALRPDHFRQSLRVTPMTFDRIVAKISGDAVFFNRSEQQQIAVEVQLAVTLFRFGHDGNAASLQSVANWAGLGKGTILLVTRRVMTAILRPSFMKDAVRMPTAEEKEDAKSWVEEHSCRAWRNGWCLVDGTLVPLANRPYWFGESYFDRKSNYSLNVQVCTDSLLGKLIICIVVRLSRSQIFV
jgi:hypothetical protein